MCESVPRVIAPRARLFRGAPPPCARRPPPSARRVAPRVTPPGVVVPLPHRGRQQPYGN